MKLAPLAALLLAVLAACSGPEVVGRQLCVQQCEAEGREFEAIEACRARCRDAYNSDSAGGGSV